jgi:radical SAM superfamily enzyme YgiQ (UPF0313 family)
MYRNLRFERRPVSDIVKDIKTAASCTREVRSVFIGDSNSLVMDTQKLVEMLWLLYRLFPRLERVTTYARAKTLSKKPPAELARLRGAGLTRLHVGLETGSGLLLEKIKKGVTPEECIQACRAVKDAGFELSLYVLLGIGQEDDSALHARETAAVLNAIDPHFIRVRTLQPQPGSNIYTDMKNGTFTKASQKTVLCEQKTLIERLTGSSVYLSDHITNYAPVNGRLPGDRQAMIALIEQYLEGLEQDNERVRSSLNRADRLRRL